MTDRRRGAEAARTGAGAGDSGAERGKGTGQRDSIADGTALRCGRVGSRHFRRAEDSSPGFFVFIQSVNVLHKKDRECNEHLRQKKKICGAKTSRTLPSYVYLNLVQVVSTRVCSALPKN